ncbi:MAG: ABC transporter ATP-binding protein [Chloroflexi bacterium]|nr:ABC transporter ATP-binding protein [Chloroflexota bacterium]
MRAKAIRGDRGERPERAQRTDGGRPDDDGRPERTPHQRSEREVDATASVIRARGLTKRYGDVLAVDHLNLDVRPGEVFGLLGPNGAGKTTTILMLLGLSEPTDGHAEVAGFDPTRDPLEVKRRVGYMPDDVGFYGALTGRQNLRYTARLNGIDRRDVEGRLDALLEQVGLRDVADRAVETYSRGMRQRLGLADALVKDPSVVVLDEPTTAIDPAGVAEVLDLIASIARDRGAAVLLSSHLLHQVQQVCDRVAVFVGGRVVAQGTMRRLAEQMGGESLQMEVGAQGAPEEVEAALRSIDGVREVERDPHDTRLWRVAGARNLQPRLAGELSARGIGVWHLRRIGDDLDEIYMRYFAKEGPGDDSAA